MRTKYCKDLITSSINQKVTLCGWVNQKRNLGKLIFIDLRDNTGIVQVIFNPKYFFEFKKVIKLRNDFCIKITGLTTLKKQIYKKNYINKINTIEIIAFKLKIFNKTLPIPLDYTKKNKENIRFKFRYLDLRCLKMVKNLKIRNIITKNVRKFLEEKNFLEIETPILTKSTPEGATDYLVKSRLYDNKYYALPQSPQLFKQLLMISGLDKYYQIAKCFRDEDLRSDRQPEFTQIDMEVSFTTTKNFKKIITNLIKKLWLSVKKINIKKFKKLTYQDSLNKYGTDKPDLRNPIQFINIAQILYKNDINFKENLNKFSNIRVISIVIPNGLYLLNQKKINFYIEFFKSNNITYYSIIKILNIQKKIFKKIGELQKKIDNNIISNIINFTSAKNNDIIIILEGEEKILNNYGSVLRMMVGKDLKIINVLGFCPVWITNFPMFKINDDNKIISVHHPFTAPKKEINSILKLNPLKIISSAFDLVINGYEIGGGSVRIHDYNLQTQIFDLLNIKKKEQDKKFGFFLQALKYGAPPHIGMALGLDRITMLLTNSTTIKDVIAFPKTHSATCLMTGAPN